MSNLKKCPICGALALDKMNDYYLCIECNSMIPLDTSIGKEIAGEVAGEVAEGILGAIFDALT